MVTLVNSMCGFPTSWPSQIQLVNNLWFNLIQPHIFDALVRLWQHCVANRILQTSIAYITSAKILIVVVKRQSHISPTYFDWRILLWWTAKTAIYDSKLIQFISWIHSWVHINVMTNGIAHLKLNFFFLKQCSRCLQIYGSDSWDLINLYGLFLMQAV